MHRRMRSFVVTVLVLALGALAAPPATAADAPGGPPAVTGLAPAVVARGASLTVTGTGLADPAAVTVNGVPAVVTAAAATELTLTVPGAATSGPSW